MKIAYVARGKLDDRSLWSGLISYYYESIKDEYDIFPIIIPEGTGRKVIRGIMHILSSITGGMINPMSPFDRLDLKRGLQEVRAQGCDILFAPTGSDFICDKKIASGFKIIYLTDCTYHLMDGYYWNENPFRRKAKNRMEQTAFDRSDVIITASKWAKDDMITYYHQNPDKILIAPFGANLEDKYSGKTDGKINEYGIPHKYGKQLKERKEIKLLCCGVDWVRKGIDLAVAATEILNNRQTDGYRYTLTVIGFAKPEACDAKSVNFVGRLDKNDPEQFDQMIALYEESDLFILPTKAECAGIVFSEASMYGMPSVTHNTGGIPNYVENDYNGTRLELGSSAEDFAAAVEYIICDGKYKQYSQNARNKYENDINWKHWKQVFDDAVECVT